MAPLCAGAALTGDRDPGLGWAHPGHVNATDDFGMMMCVDDGGTQNAQGVQLIPTQCGCKG